MRRNKSESLTGATAALARSLGIELEYINAAQQQVAIAPDVVRTLIAALGYQVHDDTEAEALLKGLNEREHSRKLPPVMVVRQDLQPAQIALNVEDENRQYDWRIIAETGETLARGSVLPQASGSRSLSSAIHAGSATIWVSLNVELRCGYHRFEIDGQSMPLIIVPVRCWLGPAENGEKIWGIAAQLYLLRSGRNWGIGDFTDLLSLIDIAAKWGASIIGLNPLHALFLDDPEQASPYAPASRLFLNVLNIDVTRIPEFSTCEPANSLLANSEFTAGLEKLRAEKMVNYTAVAEMKLKMLRLVHSYFKAAAHGERKRALEDFTQRRGESLRQFCAFQAMRLENDSNAAGHPLDGLPAADSPRFIEFAASRQEQIDFLTWAQWVADSQLSEAARHAEANGIRLGLYRDLAVGSSASGAEVWSNPDTVVRQAHAGAPPDIVNPAGQDWNLPPFHPRALREAAYAPFIELVRANMRYSGALRIDHAVGLQHLYWVPAGQKPDHGAYVTYPFDDLAGILALESQRNHCLIIGEDLGTVPAGFSRKLNERGILSNRVLYFEQDPEFGRFSLPEEYPSLALASIATHDLATLKGWWLGDDIAIREEHHLYPDPLEAERQRGIRQKEKRNLLAALRLEGLEPRNGNEFNSLCRAVHSFLARTSAAIVMLELENLSGEKSQTNLPGSITYPNWRRRYTKSVEELSQDPDVIAVIEAVNRERPRSRV